MSERTTLSVRVSHRLTVFVLLSLTAIAAAPAQPETPGVMASQMVPAPPRQPTVADVARNRIVTALTYPSSDGRKIPAVLSMPAGDGPFPGVVTIHGGQGNRDLAFIRTLAVPGGISPTVTMLNEQPWAVLAISYRAGGGAVLGLEQDDVVAGIRFAKTLPRIDPTRVFATGISNGGIFSHFLAARRSERIAAIAPVAGGIADPFHRQFQPAAPVSVLIIQGTRDPLVPYDGGPVAGGGLRDRGLVIPTEEAAKLWARHNACAAEPATRPLPDRDPKDGCVTTSLAWTNCKDGTEVAPYRVEGGGHTWPSGAQYLPQFVIG
jgi:polyhydroxybutyrate depolymerase